MGRRLGKIKISFTVVEGLADEASVADFRRVQAVFKRFIPVGCECVFHGNAFEYVGHYP